MQLHEYCVKSFLDLQFDCRIQCVFTMLKNVTIRDASGNIVGTYETFPRGEAEQREMLRKSFGPGRYKISYHKNGPKNLTVFVGLNGAAESHRSAMPFSGFPTTDKIDLTIYRELILPMAQNITERLDEIKTLLIDSMSDEQEDTSPMGNTEVGNPEPKDNSTRIAEALERVQNGEPIESLIADYADLIPSQFAGMAPALLGMMSQKNAE